MRQSGSMSLIEFNLFVYFQRRIEIAVVLRKINLNSFTHIQLNICTEYIDTLLFLKYFSPICYLSQVLCTSLFHEHTVGLIFINSFSGGSASCRREGIAVVDLGKPSVTEWFWKDDIMIDVSVCTSLMVLFLLKKYPEIVINRILFSYFNLWNYSLIQQNFALLWV